MVVITGEYSCYYSGYSGVQWSYPGHSGRVHWIAGVHSGVHCRALTEPGGGFSRACVGYDSIGGYWSGLNFKEVYCPCICRTNGAVIASFGLHADPA